MSTFVQQPQEVNAHLAHAHNLRVFFDLMDTIANIVGPHCEVVLHSLDNLDYSVVKIVNGHITGREVGAPITDLGLRWLRNFEATGATVTPSYFSRNKNGDLLKSTTTILVDEQGIPMGMLCINLNLSYPLNKIIAGLLPDNAVMPLLDGEFFASHPKESLEQALNLAIEAVETEEGIGGKTRNRAIIQKLFNSGMFELKEATGFFAERLGITRHAIYKYLREFKQMHH